MKRVLTVAVCMLVVPALGVVGLASAEALPAFYECAKVKGGTYEDKLCSKEAGTVKGERYELREGIGKGKAFKGNGGATRLYTPALNAPVPCTGSKDSGKLVTPTTVEDLMITFTGCSTMFKPCTSPGAKRGEVRTEQLDGRLGAIAEGDPGLLAVAHTVKGAGSIATIFCEGLTVEVSGSVIGEMSGDVNTISKSLTLTYAATEAGEQTVTKFEGGETEVLESTFDGSGPFASSLTGAIVNKTEALEVKT